MWGPEAQVHVALTELRNLCNLGVLSSHGDNHSAPASGYCDDYTLNSQYRRNWDEGLSWISAMRAIDDDDDGHHYHLYYLELFLVHNKRSVEYWLSLVLSTIILK